MLNETTRAQGHPVHGALNHGRGRLAVVACALAFAALQRGKKIRIGIDPASNRAALQVQAQRNDQGAEAKERQGSAQQFLILISGERGRKG